VIGKRVKLEPVPMTTGCATKKSTTPRRPKRKVVVVPMVVPEPTPEPVAPEPVVEEPAKPEVETISEEE